MEENVTITDIHWRSDAGLPQVRYQVVRKDGLELGNIYPSDYHPANQPKAIYHAMVSADTLGYKSKYFANFNNAVRWLERLHKNIYPISRLAEVVNGNE